MSSPAVSRRSSIGCARRCTLALVLLALAGGTEASAAHRRRDVIELTNGDRVTGEIIRLESGTLSVQTAALGNVSIDWPDIASLVSEQLFEVRLSDGRRLVGAFGKSGQPGQLELLTVDQGNSPVP